MRITEIVETTADTRKRLSEKTDVELIRFLIDVQESIDQGFEHAIYYQEWSVGTSILWHRGYGFLSQNDLRELAKEKGIL